MKAWPIIFRTILIAGGLLARLAAQDVIAGPLTWAGGGSAPDQAPGSDRLQPSFPNQARDTDEIGYAWMLSHVAEDGTQIGRVIVGSEIVWEQAVKDELRYWKLRPAQRSGHPIVSAALQSFIFNPRSAAPAGPQATPRLLAVTPIYLADFARWHLGTHPVVRVTISLDAAGKVIQVELPAGSPLPAETVRTAIGSWRFAPARQNGQPAPATVALNAVLLPRPRADLANFVPPKLIKKYFNGYPESMLWCHLGGEVSLNFTVNQLGVVENISVAESNNPGFEEEALDDVRRWRFQPAQLNGQPVSAPEHALVRFELLERGTRDAYTMTSSSSLPEAYRYDVAPKVRGTIQPVYPYPLLASSDHGEATVAFTIGTDGRVHSTRVMKATRPEYGLAVAAAVAHFRFDPALRKGKPVMTISSLHQDFNSSMRLPGITDGTAGDEMSFAESIQKHPEQIISSRLLDAPPHAFSRRAAVFPPDLTTAKQGTAVVRVIIDDTGHARLPRVASASDPAFGYAAVQAAQYWRFDPPKSHGKPVMTVVDVPFTFAAQG